MLGQLAPASGRYVRAMFQFGRMRIYQNASKMGGHVHLIGNDIGPIGAQTDANCFKRPFVFSTHIIHGDCRFDISTDWHVIVISRETMCP